MCGQAEGVRIPCPAARVSRDEAVACDDLLPAIHDCITRLKKTVRYPLRSILRLLCRHGLDFRHAGRFSHAYSAGALPIVFR